MWGSSRKQVGNYHIEGCIREWKRCGGGQHEVIATRTRRGGAQKVGGGIDTGDASARAVVAKIEPGAYPDF